MIVDLLGGLSPADPLVECFNYSGEPPDRAQFEEEGCMRLVLTSHLLFKDNAYQLVSGADELRPLFAPVESADEALSYALAATDLYARYGQEIDPDRQYLVDEVATRRTPPRLLACCQDVTREASYPALLHFLL